MLGRSRVRSAVAVAVLLAAVAIPMSPATAVPAPDQVLVWNQHAYDELLVTGAQPPPLAVLHFAMVHGAMYDAVNAIDGRHEPYLMAIDAKRGYSQDAAAATAAYLVLLDILPARAAQLGAYYDESLSFVPDGPREDGGVMVGEAAAAAMIAFRTGDGRVFPPATVGFTEGTLAGEWRAIPLGANNFRWVGQVRPFLIDTTSRFTTEGPNDLTSAEYTAEYEQVKALGRATGSTRTTDQTNAALFWSENPIATWDRIARQLSMSERLTRAENARLFAMLFTTGADAAISCFEDKELWHFWRPQTAIQLGDFDGNADTVGDPTWTSLLPNPPYPDHPSGHNCFSWSVVRTFQHFFGTDRMSFGTTNVAANLTRSFTSFSQAGREIIRARVWAGIHFLTADVQGARLGRQVASYRQAHYFQPA